MSKSSPLPLSGPQRCAAISLMGQHGQSRCVCWFFAINGLGSGQTRERIPSNARARKIAAPTKPITTVIVSNIANVPLRHCATENGGHLAQSKRFPGTNTQSHRPRVCATDVHRLVIQRQEFGISRHAGLLSACCWMMMIIALPSMTSGSRVSWPANLPKRGSHRDFHRALRHRSA